MKSITAVQRALLPGHRFEVRYLSLSKYASPIRVEGNAPPAGSRFLKELAERARLAQVQEREMQLA